MSVVSQIGTKLLATVFFLDSVDGLVNRGLRLGFGLFCCGVEGKVASGESKMHARILFTDHLLLRNDERRLST